MAPTFSFHRDVAFLIVLMFTVTGFAQEHQHGSTDEQVKPPKIFLDKSEKVIQYQLKRLDNTRLLLAERKTDDPKYLPVYKAILVRDGLASGDRADALQAIATILQSDPVTELLSIIPTLNDNNKNESRVAKQLARSLVGQSPESLAMQTDKLVAAATADHGVLKLAGFSGLLTAGKSEQAFELAKQNEVFLSALLDSIPLLKEKKLRNSLQEKVIAALDNSQPENVRLAAVKALAFIDSDPGLNYLSLAPLVSEEPLRRAAINGLLKIPNINRDPSASAQLAEFLVNHAETTVPADRTSNQFFEAMQLADQVLNIIDAERSDAYRKRLSAVIVRVVMIHTVEEEMRYDTPWFAVEAGRDVQVILKNEDLMAHNLVITIPDALQEIALLAAADGPTIGASGKQYVPDSDKVLFATEMVQAEKHARLTFTAPTEPGEYPYVCTFPGHWMRMYGVMVVVENLAKFQRAPVEPKDPVGSNRPIVKAWLPEDFEGKLAGGLRGRTEKIGLKIFNEATCALCHKVKGEGKEVGPDLTEVFTRWKGDAGSVLREVIEPSHKIEPKYIVRKIMTIDGNVVSGIVLSEDKKTISILPNPESLEPTVVQKDDIEDMVQSSVSIMPKGLMDRFTEDEILELLAYLKTAETTK